MTWGIFLSGLKHHSTAKACHYYEEHTKLNKIRALSITFVNILYQHPSVRFKPYTLELRVLWLKLQKLLIFKRRNEKMHKPWFLRVCSTNLLETLLEKEKLLVTSNFSFSHCVFYLFGELFAIFNNFRTCLHTLLVWKHPKFIVCHRDLYHNNWILRLGQFPETHASTASYP